MSSLDTISTFDVVTDTHAIETKCRGQGPLTYAAWRRGDLERQIRAVHLGNFDTREAAETACRTDLNLTCPQATVGNGASAHGVSDFLPRDSVESRERDSGAITPHEEHAPC